MPVRRGHVAPQNTFLDTIIRKFEGQSEWGRGRRGRGRGTGRGASSSECEWGKGGVPGTCASAKCESKGLMSSGRWPGGKAWCWGPGDLMLGRRVGGSVQSSGMGRACDAECAGREMGWGCAGIPDSGCLDMGARTGDRYLPNCGTSTGLVGARLDCAVGEGTPACRIIA